MMYSSYREFTPDSLPMPHSHDVFFGDMSTQMAISRSTRRHSKGSAGQQQRNGSKARISKPCSTNTSPRLSASRRRVAAIDCSVPQRQRQTVESVSANQIHNMATSCEQSSRPLSWHTTSHLPQPPRQPFTTYPYPYSTVYSDTNDQYASRPHFSPMMTAYSNDTSPCSTFSPLPLFPSSGESVTYTQPSAWDCPPKKDASYPPSVAPSTSVPFSIYDGTTRRPQSDESAEWDVLAAQRYGTSPPTPESFTQIPHSQPVVSGENERYDHLTNVEDDGEVLVGMGLYDAPEKFAEDPQLSNYRSTISALLGSSLRPREPQGKGLKLEETWEPPKSDDEDDDDDDGEDAEEN